MTGVPVICLDEIWKPHWSQRDLPEFRALVKELHAGEDWISDGNFSVATFDLRLPLATHVVWLECPRMVCVLRAIRRTFSPGEYHQKRDLLKVIRFIWKFDRVNRPRIEGQRIIHGADLPVVRLDTHRESDKLPAFMSEV